MKLRALMIVFCFGLTCAAAHAEGPGEFTRETIDVGVVVKDVAKSIKFYTEAIGFTEQAGFKVSGAYSAEVGLTDGAEELDVHVLTLGKADTATKLKLMQFKREPKADDNEAINSQRGYRYLTIFVNDTGAALERLKKYGAKPLAKGPSPLPEGFPKGVFLTLVRDPDGNFIELIGPKK